MPLPIREEEIAPQCQCVQGETIFTVFHPHNFKHSKVFSIQTDLTLSCFLNKGPEINLELKDHDDDEQAAHCCLSSRRGHH